MRSYNTETETDSISSNSSIEYNEDAIKIREEYGFSALKAYCKVFFEYPETVEYDKFEEAYIGYFGTREEFIDHMLEDLHDLEIPPWVEINYEKTWSNMKDDFDEESDEYFWNCKT